MYSRGWFGLIPLIGGIVGLGLIALGVFKYKDRKLIIIGSAALLFTVVVYSSIIFYFEYSEAFRKDFAVFSKPAMDELIKSIEFYKTQNGQYPDSLQELTKESKLVQIHDPISQREDGERRGLFYYQRVDNRYFLFSAGVDKKPFTEDDIFPSVTYFDSTKTGLIKPLF